MRTVELAKVAANAEKLRLKALARRQGMRAIYGAVAGVFALAVLVLVHVIGYQLLLAILSPVPSLLVVTAVDIVVIVVCGILALSSTPSAIETEATEVRKQALREMRTTLTVMGMVAPATRLLGGRRSTGLALGALAARLISRR